MRASLLGFGCITPAGRDPSEVWEALRTDHRPPVCWREEEGIRYPCRIVNPELWSDVERERRLRRASPISLMMAAAGLDALSKATPPTSDSSRSKIGLVAAVSSGSVRYTRRFYDTVVREGAASASPLLFPETVYNAPASHLASILGLEGPTHTVVGDSSVGLQALAMGAEMLASGVVEHVLVASAEEADPLLHAAYRVWRLFGNNPASLPVYGEAGAAVLLGPPDPRQPTVEIHSGRSFSRARDFPNALRPVLEDLRRRGPFHGVVTSANGGRRDITEASLIREILGNPPLLHPKLTLGESLGAAGLLQLLTAHLWQKSTPDAFDGKEPNSTLVSGWGWNFHTAGLRLTPPQKPENSNP